MNYKTDIKISDNGVMFALPDDQGKIVITNVFMSDDSEGTYISVKDGKVIAIQQKLHEKVVKDMGATQVVKIYPNWDLETTYITRGLMNLAEENKLEIKKTRVKAIPENQRKTVAEFVDMIVSLLSIFNISFTPTAQAEDVLTSAKAKPAKAQHRWNKDVAKIKFTVDFRGCQAEVYWQKRNEMLIKKGATMLAEAPKNKDGSVGFSERVGDQLRQEQEGNFKDFVTTTDIILKSVNEVGLFLYYAGTNSWLQLKDKNGKTIDEYTVVK
ncbi:hypothetical protein BG262_08315 [Floricoccus penangensis]|uniref:Uncharacterized protein n=1 Tax=Floricoccus penangensis TaxID=1859475 RepID=A0A9Q5P0J1_9LACT|nr:hypothetical protein [Floricoccus penangensis]OFI47698.1 hypothetical protein BG262_08315 [Floricoccus penangensis]